ncbi:hypothetical protein [Ewingella americana]|uniref:Uncharacterized protein n=1 Tax=Ewingella americana TaxID=41202 RepID=A0A502GGY0_9GAMM|nr:hypothetical protein [Ewingella americana]TPG59983.1 hypothetical protein EAH77_15565 [Ewingella americana]
MATKYTLRRDVTFTSKDCKSVPAPAGTVVYDLRGPDYGCANQDTQNTGIKHISVTLDPTGDYPGLSVSMYDLQQIVEGD